MAGLRSFFRISCLIICVSSVVTVTIGCNKNQSEPPAEKPPVVQDMNIQPEDSSNSKEE